MPVCKLSIVGMGWFSKGRFGLLSLSPWFVAPSAMATEATLAFLEQLTAALPVLGIVSRMDSGDHILAGRFTPFSVSILDSVWDKRCSSSRLHSSKWA